MNNIKEHYDAIALQRDKYRAKNKYYYQQLEKHYRYFIPKGKKVLEVGCGTGDLLKALEPSYGVGVDISEEMVKLAKEKYSNLQFYSGKIENLKEEKFDYIVLSGLLGELEDIQSFLEGLKKFCTQDTRIIIEYYSYFWQYILKIGEQLDLKIPQKIQNWLSAQDISNFLTLADFDVIKKERRILFPKYVWGLSTFLNRFVANLPIINTLTLNHFIIARMTIHKEQEYSTTILVPCRNEKGNIESAITRTPEFGTHQEFIFVEGGSQDGTCEEVERIIAKYSKKDIKLFRQEGKGKGDAVRLGFSKSTCDILMILDADLTVPPEDLPKFYEAMRTGRGEYINGCRLVYQMENEAMQFLNLIANKFFGIFFSWLLETPFKDTLCGTKVMFRHHYEELVANRSYFGDFDPFGDFDLIFGATKLNLKVVEVPIRYRNRQYGSTQIQRFRHGILLFRMCFFAMRKIKFR
ncbi:Glycosyltransferase [hydrothermal vent metagenome]|uniref:Glycosyltransferase n=1 Tax=hydrothermal vent metagenome TaxID=652676 RepID=A0A3B1CYV5_9ZZZZ